MRRSADCSGFSNVLANGEGGRSLEGVPVLAAAYRQSFASNFAHFRRDSRKGILALLQALLAL